ncbi:MAG: hypothetical protein ABJM43_01510 [Paracoccaceae bacterium]
MNFLYVDSSCKKKLVGIAMFFLLCFPISVFAQTQPVLDVGTQARLLFDDYDSETNTFRAANHNAIFGEGRDLDLSSFGFTFWGLKLADPDDFLQFIKGHPMKCFVVHVAQTVRHIDCSMEPTANLKYLSYAGTPDWLDLYKWLPKFGMASRICSTELFSHLKPSSSISFLYPPDARLDVYYDDFRHYQCREGTPFRSKVIYH